MKTTGKAPSPTGQPEWDDLIHRCSMLHHDLIKGEFYATGQEMHKVVRRIGYEAAERLEKERPTGRD